MSPNRQEIAFVSGGDVWTVPVTGSEARLLVAHPATESRPLYARRTTLRVSADGKERDVVVRPLSRDTEKALDYHQWVEERCAYLAQASGGRLGYVPMFDMSAGALAQLYLDLDAENMTRDGVVVNVRNTTAAS